MLFKNKDEERWFNQMRFGIYGTTEEIEESLPGALLVIGIVIAIGVIFWILK